MIWEGFVRFTHSVSAKYANASTLQMFSLKLAKTLQPYFIVASIFFS